MVDMKEINSTIEQLENGATTFDSCMKLASLYVIRENLRSNLVESELDDVLPQYRKYCVVKRRNQLNEVPSEMVHQSLNCLCQEIREFMEALYSSSSSEFEKNMLVNTVNSLANKWS